MFTVILALINTLCDGNYEALFVGTFIIDIITIVVIGDIIMTYVTKGVENND